MTATADSGMLEPKMMQTRALRLAMRRMSSGNLRPDESQYRRLREFAQVGDPQADAVVAAMHQNPGGRVRAKFEQALAHGIDTVEDPPQPLLDFFHSVESTPYWLDLDEVDRGARAITRAGPWGLIALGDMALVGGYLASRTAKTLVGTGDIEYMADRRLTETSLWWMDLTTPGSLRGRGNGYAAALRVRLVHAHVRAAMNRRPDWDHEKWDHPINQAQLAGTLLLFSHIFVVGMWLMGVRYDESERAAILHAWRYIGWLLGVDDELLPATESDCWRLLWLLDATEFRPDEDSRRLTEAYLATHDSLGETFGWLRKPVARLSRSYRSSVSRMALGKENADFLGLPDSAPGKAAVMGTAVFTYAMETARRHVPGATALQRQAGVQMRRSLGRYLTKRYELDRSYGNRLPAKK